MSEPEKNSGTDLKKDDYFFFIDKSEAKQHNNGFLCNNKQHMIDLNNYVNELNDKEAIPIDNVSGKTIDSGKSKPYTTNQIYPKLFVNFTKTYPRLQSNTQFHGRTDVSRFILINGLEQFYNFQEDRIRTFYKVDKIVIDGAIPDIDSFLERLKVFRNVKHLNLLNTTLTRLDFSQKLNGEVKELRWLEISGDRIANANEIILAIQSFPKLNSIDYSGTKFRGDDNLKCRIIKRFPGIDYINGEQVTTQTMIECILEHGPPSEENYQLFFKNNVLRIRDVRSFFDDKSITRNFEPSLMKVLSLVNCGLQKVYLSEFTELVALSLKGNNIYTLDRSGIECCQKLISVDLSDNIINSIYEITDLSLIPTLKHLVIHSNEFKKNPREELINMLRKLPGTASLSGIQTIDEVPVTIDEFVKASKSSKEESLNNKWWYNLQHVVGGNLIEQEKFNFGTALTNLVNLSLPCRGLHKVDLSMLKNLKYLNLRGNFLKTVDNLYTCTQLISLDLSDNVPLDLKSTLEQITHLTELISLNISNDTFRKQNQLLNGEMTGRKTGEANNENHRNSILKKLLPSCTKLTYLDMLAINPEQRLIFSGNINEDIEHASPEQKMLLQKLTMLDLISSNTSYDKIEEGEEEKFFEKIEEINFTYIYKNIFDLSAFSRLKNIINLDLSPNEEDYKAGKCKSYLNLFQKKDGHNLIPEWIKDLKSLKFLSLKFCNVEEDVEGKIETLNSLPNLIAFNSYNDSSKINEDIKIKVLQGIKERLINLDDCLREVETEINPVQLSEIKVIDKSDDYINYCIKFRTEPDHDFEHGFDKLDLSGLELETVDLSDYRGFNICKQIILLDLSNNKLNKSSFDNSNLENILSINLSNNEFDSYEDVGSILANIPSLKNACVLGQSNNETEDDARAEVLLQIGKKIKKSTKEYNADELMHKLCDYPLKSLENKWILPSEWENVVANIFDLDEYKAPVEMIIYFGLNRRKVSYNLVKEASTPAYAGDYYEEDEIETDTKSTYYIDKMEGGYCIENYDEDRKTFDLSSLELEFKEEINFRLLIDYFLSCETLDLSNNKIDELSLKFLNVCDEHRDDIKVLKLNNNNIDIGDDAAELINFLDQFLNLRVLEINNNPISSPKNMEIFFKKYERLLRLETTIERINDIKIDHAFKSKYIDNANPELVQSFRDVEKVMTRYKDFPRIPFINFSNLKLKSINVGPWLYKNVRVLDLSNNQIEKLDYQIFEKLENLETLDISNNQLVPYEKTGKLIDAVTEPLGLGCLHLTSLTMTNCFKDKSCDKKVYFTKVCQRMRKLITLDGAPNAHSLTPTQQTQLYEIMKLTNDKWYYPNHCDIIDLTGIEYEGPEWANKLANALIYIQPSRLIIPESYVKEIQYIFITKVESLKKLNNDKIDYLHRLQARKEFNKKLASANLGGILLEGLDQIDELKEKAEKYMSYPDKIVKYGTMVSKFEIFITFQQMLKAIINYITVVKWPKLFLKFQQFYLFLAVNLAVIVNIIEKALSFANVTVPEPVLYFQFFIYTVVPICCIVLYKIEMRKEWFYKYCVVNFCRTIGIFIFALIMMLFCSWGLSAIFSLNEIIYEKKVVSNFYGYGFWLSLASIVVFIALWVGTWYFKKQATLDTNEFWWDEFKIKKASFFLFVMTVLYNPAIDFFTAMIACNEEGDEHLSQAFDALICFDLQSPATTITFAHCFAILCIVVYSLLIPIIFIIEVRNAINYLSKVRGIALFELEIKNIKQQIKTLKKYNVITVTEQMNNGTLDVIENYDGTVEKGRKKYDLQRAEEILIMKQQRFDDAFKYEADNYDHPAAYLYQQYTYNKKYSKVLDMCQKAATTLLTALYKTKFVGKILVHLTVHGFFLLNLITSPFYSYIESILKSSSQGSNSGTIVIGEVLQSNGLKDYVSNPLIMYALAPGLLILLVLTVFVCFVFFSIKYHCSCTKKEADDNNAQTTTTTTTQTAISNNQEGNIVFEYAQCDLDYDPGDAPEESVETQEESDKNWRKTIHSSDEFYEQEADNEEFHRNMADREQQKIKRYQFGMPDSFKKFDIFRLNTEDYLDYI